MNQIIIIGLGNPGSRYRFSRHNVGFMAIDQLATSKVEWQVKKNPDHQTSSLIFNQTKLILVKPTTYMNQSGLVAKKLHRQYPQITLNNWFVIHDDLDLELGHYKIRLGGGPKEHNGLRSIYTQLGSKEFWHVRVGIDGRFGDRSVEGSQYVLQTFSPSELLTLKQVLVDLSGDLLNRWQISK